MARYHILESPLTGKLSGKALMEPQTSKSAGMVTKVFYGVSFLLQEPQKVSASKFCGISSSYIAKKKKGGGATCTFNTMEKKGRLENPGIDPGTSRMLSERSTI